MGAWVRCCSPYMLVHHLSLLTSTFLYVYGYADDTQPYVSFCPDSQQSHHDALDALQACVYTSLDVKKQAKN